MTPNDFSHLYDAYYYAHCCGEPYQRSDSWLGAFDRIAEHIATDIEPSTVLDAGCAIGLLVETLRRRGVDAWGIDISEYAILNVNPDIQAYCQLGSVLEPFPRPHYDLITCIEVLEHLPPQDAEKAIKNLCDHSDDILFSSTPLDFRETTHINIQPPEYWVNIFGRYGFAHDVDFDASFLTPWAMRLRRLRHPLSRTISAYERRLWTLRQENQARREFNLDQRQELMAKEGEIQNMLLKVNQAEQYSEHLQGVANDLLEQVNIKETNNQILYNQLVEREQQVADLYQIIGEKEFAIQDILTSRSWRFIQKIQQLRLRLIPLGSRRERLMQSTFAGVNLLLREGPIGFIRRANEKSSRKLKSLALRRRYAQTLSKQDFPVQPVQSEAPALPPPHQASVDIIVCVHNALEDVQRCLESLVRYTLPPYTVILVDDGSDAPTQEYLADFARSQAVTLLRNDQARGYTFAANQGLRKSTGDYAILLNSDTILTPGWLDRMIACGESDSKIGIIGPLANTASWQSVPELFDATGDWAENALPEELTTSEMAAWVANYSSRQYPRLPFLNGFCLAIKRTLITDIGIFDEEAFGEGYGEENDYCLRAVKAGWQLAVADDTYIYHAQSRSYSHERRKVLAERADKALAAKHGQGAVSDGAYICRFDPVMVGNRARSQVMALRQQTIEEGKKRWEGKRLLFILPISEPGGGGHVIIQEAEAMLKMGVDVRILNLKGHQQFFESAYPDLKIPTLYVDGPRLAAGLLYNYDAVIGTVYHSLNWMDLPSSGGKIPVRGYYIQDFEPHFFSPGSPDYQTAWNSYTRFPDLVRITKTEWNRNIIQEQIGVGCHVVGPSLDIELFRPRRRNDPNWPDRPLRVTAMVRPSTPRRQPGFTLQVLSKLIQRHGANIEAIIFGCQPDDPDFHKLIREHRELASVPWRHAGVLTRSQLASLMNEVDIFADFSSFQAMGLTAMEAMSCGAVALLPKEGGASSFARHEENAFVADTNSLEASVEALERLLKDDALRHKLQQQAIFDMCQFYPEKAAYKTLEALFS